jgi:hypothetical protein
MVEVAHLSWIEETQRIDCSFDGSHQLDGTFTQFFVKILPLADPNTMLSGA